MKRSYRKLPIERLPWRGLSLLGGFSVDIPQEPTLNKEVIIMPRYLVLWEVNQAKIPTNPKEAGTGWAVLMKMVRQDQEKGIMKHWGAFVGEGRGYDVLEGSELDVMKTIQQYVPFVRVRVHPLASESQVNELIKALIG